MNVYSWFYIELNLLPVLVSHQVSVLIGSPALHLSSQAAIFRLFSFSFSKHGFTSFTRQLTNLCANNTNVKISCISLDMCILGEFKYYYSDFML